MNKNEFEKRLKGIELFVNDDNNIDYDYIITILSGHFASQSIDASRNGYENSAKWYQEIINKLEGGN